MPDLRALVDTVVLVMLENRSFDHMLGHLSLEGLVPGVDGLTRPLDAARWANPWNGTPYAPWPRTSDDPLSCDLPHEAGPVATQLAWSDVTGTYAMNGFVEAYAAMKGCRVQSSQAEPMAYFPSAQVPVTSFLAREYCTCDRWFAPLPTSTQPNKTMFLTGASPIAASGGLVQGAGPSVLDWLDAHGVRWRVYSEGLTFFALYPEQLPHVVGPNFRAANRLALDVLQEPAESWPQVVIVEPAYDSVERPLGRHGNDNHAPLPVGFGEAFLRRTYEALVANPARWARTVLVVMYDEHGGFWDHVPPLLDVHQPVPGAPDGVFTSTGPRVPAIVVSPLVDAGSVCHAPLDHTSVLQLLAERFGDPGESYSPSVAARAQKIASASVAITRTTPRAAAPPHAPDVTFAPPTTLSPPSAPSDPMQAAFAAAVDDLTARRPDAARTLYPELVHWRATVAV